MKVISALLVVSLILGLAVCFGLSTVNEHIDRESGAIVERTLADNTINQLKVLSVIQSEINAGNIELAKKKLAESISTLEYILKNNCSLAKCEEALSNYASK